MTTSHLKKKINSSRHANSLMKFTASMKHFFFASPVFLKTCLRKFNISSFRNMSNLYPVYLSSKIFDPSNGMDEKLNPIIFLHGLMGSKEYWDDIPQIVANKTKRKVFAYDARNHGDSDHADVFTFNQTVDDLFYFMDSMNIQKAVLVGHSMGGLTSTHAALKKPEKFEMIFSEDMFIKPIPQPYLNAASIFIKALSESVLGVPSGLNKSDALKFAFEQTFQNLPPDSPYLKEKDTFSQIKFDLKERSEGGYEVKFNAGAILRGLKNAEELMSNPIGKYNGPAYFLYGNLSKYSVKTDESHIKQHFPNAELIEFKGASHYVHTQFPHEFIEAILHRLKQ